MIYLPEKHVRHMVKELSLPVVPSSCPVDGKTARAEMEELISRMKKIFPDAPDRFLHALQQGEYDLWQRENESVCENQSVRNLHFAESGK